MAKMVRGWKVLRCTPEGLVSVTDFNSRVVKYPLGVRVRPNKGCGPLVVCTTKEAADFFAKNFKPSMVKATIFKIRPCWYAPSKDKSVWYDQRMEFSALPRFFPYATKSTAEQLFEANHTIIFSLETMDFADEVILPRLPRDRKPTKVGLQHE